MFIKYWGVPKDAKYGEEFMSRFPILFQERKLDCRQTCMCWGIECPIGWWHILEQLCTFLEFHNLEFVRNYGVAIIAEQVKEKYGTLRFYFSIRRVDKDGVELNGDDIRDYTPEQRIAVDTFEAIANELINKAEELTATTCADCGVPLDDDNMVETKGWITYICKDCDEKRNKKMEEWMSDTSTKDVDSTDSSLSESLDIVDE